MGWNIISAQTVDTYSAHRAWRITNNAAELRAVRATRPIYMKMRIARLRESRLYVATYVLTLSWLPSLSSWARWTFSELLFDCSHGTSSSNRTQSVWEVMHKVGMDWTIFCQPRPLILNDSLLNCHLLFPLCAFKNFCWKCASVYICSLHISAVKCVYVLYTSTYGKLHLRASHFSWLLLAIRSYRREH